MQNQTLILPFPNYTEVNGCTYKQKVIISKAGTLVFQQEGIKNEAINEQGTLLGITGSLSHINVTNLEDGVEFEIQFILIDSCNGTTTLGNGTFTVSENCLLDEEEDGGDADPDCECSPIKRQQFIATAGQINFMPASTATELISATRNGVEISILAFILDAGVFKYVPSENDNQQLLQGDRIIIKYK